MNTIKERKTKKLYQYALSKEIAIDIDENCPDSIMGIAIKLPQERYVIAMQKDEDKLLPYTRLEILAHEMGHCMTNSFYDSFTPCEGRKDAEELANLWAYTYVMNPSEIEQAYKEGAREIDDLAYYFGVSFEFVEKALDAYLTDKCEEFLESYCEFYFRSRKKEDGNERSH